MSESSDYPGMTDVTGDVEALEFDREGYRREDWWEKSMEAWNAQQECLRGHVKAAQEAGTLMGRFVTFPRCDGSAYYEVAYVQGGTAYLRWIGIGDRWHSPEVEELADTIEDPLYENGVLLGVPVGFVEKRLRSVDAWAELVGKAKDGADD